MATLRCVLAGGGILWVVSCAGAETPPGGELPAIRLDAVQLNPHRPDRDEVDRLRLVAGYELSAADPRFGGFSGLWIDADGETAIAASDGGYLWELRLEHDPSERLAAVEAVRVVEPAGLDDDPTIRLDKNIEAVAVAGTDADELVLAYEGTHRIRGLPMRDLMAVPEPWPVPPTLSGHGNSGLEGLAALPDGRLVAVVEGAKKDETGWIIDPDQGASAFTYVPRFGFEPTGADRLDDEIWLLERRFSWVGGFQSRVVRVPVDDLAPRAQIEGEAIALLRPPLTTENMEAIAVRRDGDGRTLVYLMSDDNFNVLQRTLLMQFVLGE